MSDLAQAIVSVCRDFYQTQGPIELYRPAFDAAEKNALGDVLDSGWVAMGGQTVTAFEETLSEYVGVDHAVATINATAALHLSLQCLGVGPNDLVITQANTFIAPVNAIAYVGATPVFIDVDRDTLGMSPEALAQFLEDECAAQADGLYHRVSGCRVRACLPVHALGLPCRIQEIQALCQRFGLSLIEDAAEALGSGVRDGQHCGAFGDVGIVSFNANKLITTGSGGVLLTNNQAIATQARHLSRIAKVGPTHEARFDAVGYNYGMPALNAAIGLAQWAKLDQIRASKAKLAHAYQAVLAEHVGACWIGPIEGMISNQWIMAARFDEPDHARTFIESTRAQGVLTRPLWQPLHQSRAHERAPQGTLTNTEHLYSRVVQLPSAPHWG